MTIRSKIRYLNAKFSLLPFGIIALLYGSTCLFTNTNINHLKHIEGKTVFVGEKDIPSKSVKTPHAGTVIIVENEFKTVQCNTFVTVDCEKLKCIYGQVGKKVKIWYDPSIDNCIKQVEFENKIILEYSAPYIAYLIIVVIGIIFTIVPILYLIQNPSDYYD